MANPTPLLDIHQEAEAGLIPFGDDVRIVGQTGAVEIEYAAVRKAAAIMDCPHRALIRLTGDDRIDFLHRMISNEVNDLPPGASNQALLLNAKGRIVADMLVLAGEDEHLLDVSVHDAAAVVEDFEKMLFAEKVELENAAAAWHRLSLHGPKSAALLDRLAGETFAEPDDHTHQRLSLAGVDVIVHRHDVCGTTGLDLWTHRDNVEKLYRQLRQAGEADGLKPLGWLAFNIARIEGGSPMFHIDYGSTNLPHETGLVQTLCSFTKGCYRGQEIVARMESLGHPKQILVGIRGDGEDVPIAGNAVYASGDADAATVGAVTSSTFSPMLSHTPIGFAMVKWGCHAPGTALRVPAEGRTVDVEVTGLDFLSDKSADD